MRRYCVIFAAAAWLACSACHALTVTAMSPAPNAVVNPTNTIVVTFNQAVDSASVTDKTVRIFRRGADAQFDTSDDEVITPSNLVVAGAQVTITLPGPVVEDLYRVTVVSKGGQALQFDGTNDRVSISGYGFIAPTTEVTIEFWQNVSAVKDQSTFSLQPDVSNNRMQAYVPRSTSEVVWDFGNDGGAGRLLYTPPVGLTGTWNHFALVSSQIGNYMRIYRNGVLEAQKVGSSGFVQGFYALTFGYNFVGSDLYFGGFIDEFRVWNVARTQTQIQDNMSSTLIGNETGLIGYWDFEEGSGQSVLDRSPSAKHGTLGTSASPASDDPGRVASGANLAGVTAGGVGLDGEFTGTLPSGNGTAGGNFVATFRLRTAPTANAQVLSVHAGQSLPITLQGSAVDMAALTYAVDSLPQHGNLSGTGQSRTYTPLPGYVGSDSFTFTVNDGFLNSAPATVAITVTNTAPTASAAVLPLQVTVGQPAVFTATANDAESDPLTYAWDFGDGAIGSGAIAAHSFAARGNYTATVSVSDGFASTPATVPVTVINSAPTVSAGVTPAQLKANEQATFTASGTDADNDTLTYVWDFGDGTGGSGASVTHGYVARGPYMATVRSFDGLVFSGTVTIPITVVNSPPALSAGVVPAHIRAGDTATFTAAAQDADGDPLSYTWDFGDGFAGSGAAVTHVYGARGDYVVTARVSDGFSTQSVTLLYSVGNNPPAVTATVSSAQIIVGQEVTFTAAGTDPDGDALGYVWDFGDGSTGSNTPVTHTFIAPGQYTVKVTVNDGLDSASAEVVIVVVIFALPSNDDLDGDGFSDALEESAGSSANNANDTPFGVKLTATPEPLFETSLGMKVAFGKRDGDSLSLGVAFAAPPDFKFDGEALMIDIGGNAHNLKLNSKGSAKQGAASVKVSGKPGAETLRVKLKIARSNFSTVLADEGFTDTNVVNKEVQVRISLFFGGKLFSVEHPQILTVKKHTGSSKNKK